MFFEGGGHNYQTDADVQSRFSKSGAFVMAKFTEKGLLVRRKILNKKGSHFGDKIPNSFF